MKKFISNVLIVLFPLIICGILIELFISYYPNTFNTRAKYFISNVNNIECLFLGSSHTQNGINPKFIEIKSANISYGSQDYQLNSAIFFKYIKKLTKLNKVFIELDYQSLEHKNKSDYFRLPWYYKYYDVNLGNYKIYNKTSLYLSNPTFFKNYLIDKLNPNNKTHIINNFGFLENDFGVFKELNFNEENIKKTFKARLKNRHNSESIANYKFNRSKITSIINYCNNNNIDVILLKTPAYLTYRNNYNEDKNERRRLFLDSLSLNKQNLILDFETDTRFNIKDFMNDDHLNPNGAMKLSTFINDQMKQWN